MSEIALIYRKKLKGRHSIEKVFRPLDTLHGINRIELPYDLNSLFNAFKLIIFSVKIKEKYIHITGDVHYMAIFLFWKRVIVTVHDCNYYEDLKGLKRLLMGIFWYSLPLRIAYKVVVISPYSKEQLQKHFKIEDKKVEIIPNSFYPIENIKTTENKNPFTILTIGTLPNKNLIRLIEAVMNCDNILLNIIGNLPSDLKRILTEHSIKYTNSYDISEDQIQSAFGEANLLYFASTKEGFGLPILEAQSCGLPVITSTTTSMPYVAGEGAFKVDPFSIEEIKNAIRKIKNDSLYRNKLIDKGHSNIGRFSENEFIKNYTALYNLDFNISFS